MKIKEVFHRMNFLRMFFTIVFCLVLGATYAMAAGKSTVTTVKGEGYAVKFSESMELKRIAIDSAYKDAVTTAIKNVTGEALYAGAADRLESDIVSRADRYVVSYKILAEGWMTHYDMPDAAAIIGAAEAEKEEGKKVAGGKVVLEEIPKEGDELSLIGEDEDELTDEEEEEKLRLAMMGVKALHIVIEAVVDTKSLVRDLRKYVTIADEKTGTVCIVVLGISDYKEFEALRERLERSDFIRFVSFESFRKGKFTLKASVVEGGETFYDKISEELGSDYVVIPGGTDKIIIKAEGVER